MAIGHVYALIIVGIMAGNRKDSCLVNFSEKGSIGVYLYGSSQYEYNLVETIAGGCSIVADFYFKMRFPLFQENVR